MGTLSKAIGGYGGYLCASAAVIDLMRNRARTLIYSTGLPPATVAAAIAALDLIEREPAYAALPLAKAQGVRPRTPDCRSRRARSSRWCSATPEAALEASRLLEEQGFLVVAIRPPTVPAGTARLRFTFTAQHPDAEIERLADSGAQTASWCARHVTAIFVTATGTDIGKTFVTAGLIRHYRRPAAPSRRSSRW